MHSNTQLGTLRHCKVEAESAQSARTQNSLTKGTVQEKKKDNPAFPGKTPPGATN